MRFLPSRRKLNIIPAKPLDRAIYNIKYRRGKYYVRIYLTTLLKIRICRDFSQPSPYRDLYVILMNGP